MKNGDLDPFQKSFDPPVLKDGRKKLSVDFCFALFSFSVCTLLTVHWKGKVKSFEVYSEARQKLRPFWSQSKVAQHKELLAELKKKNKEKRSLYSSGMQKPSQNESVLAMMAMIMFFWNVVFKVVNNWINLLFNQLFRLKICIGNTNLVSTQCQCKHNAFVNLSFFYFLLA